MNKLQNFVIWLDGYLDAVGDENFNISKTNVIKNKLNNLFEHVAEPATPHVSLEELGEQHGFPVLQGFPYGNTNDNNYPFGSNENVRC